VCRWPGWWTSTLHSRAGRRNLMGVIKNVFLLVMTGVLAISAGCGSGSVDQNSDAWGDPGIIIVPAYIPFVEDVILPDPIYADEEFTLKVRVSSVLEPRLLNGNVKYKLYIGGPGVNPAAPQVIRFPMWMKDDLPPGPKQDAVEFEYPAYKPLRLPAGEWFIGMQTAKTRELGGVCVQHAPLDYLGDWDEHYADPQTGRTNFVEYRLYPITVVERPGA
jgi:hypothetical protein